MPIDGAGLGAPEGTPASSRIRFPESQSNHHAQNSAHPFKILDGPLQVNQTPLTNPIPRRSRMTLGTVNHGLLNPYLKAVESGDLERLLACFAPDVEFQLAETTSVLVGKDALRAFYQERWHSFSGQKALRRRSFTNGLEVITMAEIEVTIPEMGEGFFILPIAQRFVFDSSGLIVKLTDFLDFKSAIRAPRR